MAKDNPSFKASDKTNPSKEIDSSALELHQHLLNDFLKSASSSEKSPSLQPLPKELFFTPYPYTGKALIQPPDLAPIVGRPDKVDPKKPTVAFLDVFQPNKPIDPNAVPEDIDGSGHGPLHGEISATAAEQNGYNVFRLQDKAENNGFGQWVNFSKPLESLENKIKTGELPLGKGDAINISMGQPTDMTFAQANEFLGFKKPEDIINAQNLKDKVPEIMEALKKISAEKDRPNDALKASAIIKTNEAIERIQNQGITVIQAAGNAGPDSFSIDFLKAKVQLSSGVGGQADKFSANNSLTTMANGVYGVQYIEPSLFDPKPIATLSGNFKLKGADVVFPANSIEGAVQIGRDGRPFDRQPRDFKLPMPEVPLRLPTSLLSSERLGPPTQFESTPRISNGASRYLPGPLPLAVKKGNDNANLQFSDQALANAPQAVRSIVMGTSFANISWLHDHFDELQKEKMK